MANQTVKNIYRLVPLSTPVTCRWTVGTFKVVFTLFHLDLIRVATLEAIEL